MSLRRATRVLGICNRNLWRTKHGPGQLQLLCCAFITSSHVGVQSRAGIQGSCRPRDSRGFLRASQNVFSSPTVWQQYLSTNTGQDGGEGSEERWYDIDTPEFVQIVKELQKGGGDAADRLIIDVREPEELAESGQITGTVNIPLGDVEGALRSMPDSFREKFGVNKPSQETDIIFHCRAGVRSLTAIEIANKLGYSKSRHYMRGYLGWEDHLQAEQ